MEKKIGLVLCTCHPSSHLNLGGPVWPGKKSETLSTKKSEQKGVKAVEQV
jgi:hypothetical protein